MGRSRSSRTWTGLYGWMATAATLVAGVGVSGWAMPDLPVVGPFVQKTLGKSSAAAKAVAAAKPGADKGADGKSTSGKTADAKATDAANGPNRPDSTSLPGDATGALTLPDKSNASLADSSKPEPRSPLSPFARPKKTSTKTKGGAPSSLGGEPAAASPGQTVSISQPRPPAELAGADVAAASIAPSGAATTAPNAGPVSPNSTITIATFNIQVFGTTKLANAQVRDILVHTIRQFDLVAIQEVRSKDDSVIPEFVRAINADGSRYDYVIGPRLGRTNSKEQYTFVFNTQRIEVARPSVVTLNDPQDLLHREPLVARFRAITNPPEAGFSFWLMDIHTDPDEVPQEVDALCDAFQAVVHADPGEDDVILLGDLNADETQFGRLGKIPGITWIVPRTTTTNTRGNHTYDNLLFLENATTEFTGRWGVVDMRKAFNLSLEDALKVSDHLPVWAEFDARESRTNVARRPR